jgi:muramoyltetrapeptide carboxypeptidase
MPLPCPFPPEIRTVGVFAPAGVPDPERLQRGLDQLRDWGLETVYPGRDDARDRFFAATDSRRGQRLHELLANPDVDLLLAARGGYGCARLLDQLDWGLFLARNLPLVGYSDLTALQVAAFARGYRRGVFGPMVAGDLARLPVAVEEEEELARVHASLSAALAGCTQTFGPLHCLQAGEATGPLVPANLAVLASLAGTAHVPDLSGAILVLEDVNEAAYRIDRCLYQLAQGGVLASVAGLVFAQFSRTEDAEWLPEVLADYAGRIAGPVVSGLAFGHAFPSVCLPVGTSARLLAAPQASCLEA